jgi:hypothetical protein
LDCSKDGNEKNLPPSEGTVWANDVQMSFKVPDFNGLTIQSTNHPSKLSIQPTNQPTNKKTQNKPPNDKRKSPNYIE